MKPRLLDLFCGQGGAGKGYADAGFEVVGVDNTHQVRYPFEFHCGDALEFVSRYGRDFDAIHGSPPCQAYTNCQRIRGNTHPDLVAATRDALKTTGLPYIIENVEGAPLHEPVMLCGAMFPELRVYRHRLFESNVELEVPPHPAHTQKLRKMGRAPQPGDFLHVVGNFSGVAQAREAMGIDWMTRDGLREAIPPAYTLHLSVQLYEHVTGQEWDVAA